MRWLLMSGEQRIKTRKMSDNYGIEEHDDLSAFIPGNYIAQSLVEKQAKRIKELEHEIAETKEKIDRLEYEAWKRS